MKKILLIIILLFPLFSFAQKKIKLTDSKAGTENFLMVGDWIAYNIQGDKIIHAGRLVQISDTTLQISNKQISVRELKFIGKRIKGTTGLMLLSASLGGFITGFYTLSNRPIALRVSGGIVTLGLFGIYTYIHKKSQLADITNRWKMEIIE